MHFITLLLISFCCALTVNGVQPFPAKSQQECACQGKVNEDILQSLQSCTDAICDMENCANSAATGTKERVVRARRDESTTSCQCDDEVTTALTNSLKSCVEALSEIIECETAPSSTVAPPVATPTPTAVPPVVTPMPTIVPPVVTPTTTTVPPVVTPTPSVTGRTPFCTELKNENPDAETGQYNFTVNGENVTLFCFFEEIPGSNSTSWTAIGYHFFGSPCPGDLAPINISSYLVGCGRGASNTGSCSSVIFPSFNMEYTEMIGQVIGLQYGLTTAVEKGHPLDIDAPYVDGVSLTYGHSPRKHIWTFMAGSSELDPSACPCSNESTQTVPDFIGNHYFCESANPEQSAPPEPILYLNDILWDNDQCRGAEADCCNTHALPLAQRVFSPPITEDIELRVCGNNGTDVEDVLVYLAVIVIA